jgi:hypothetical protein
MPRDVTRTCGGYLGLSPPYARWVGCLKESELDKDPKYHSIYCKKCQSHNLFALTKREN